MMGRHLFAVPVLPPRVWEAIDEISRTVVRHVCNGIRLLFR